MMAIFQRSDFDDSSEDAGIFIEHLAAALVTWTAMQDRLGVTVAEAALSFNTTPEVIREAIKDAAWILVVNEYDPDSTKQLIELDGE
jgi:hypothetical protein